MIVNRIEQIGGLTVVYLCGLIKIMSFNVRLFLPMFNQRPDFSHAAADITRASNDARAA